MNFELPTSTKAKLVDVDVLSAKNRPPDANPGVSLAFSVELPNSALTMLDGFLRGALYTKSASTETPPQKPLDGVEQVSDLPNLTTIGRKIGRFSWELELTGFTLTFDYGAGGRSNLVVEDCKLDSFHVQPKEGGTIILAFKAEANDVDEQVFGKVATLKSRDVQILLAGPVVDQELTEESVFPNKPKGEAVQQEEGEVLWPFPNAAPGSPAAAANAKVAAAKAKAAKPKAKTPEQALEEASK